MTYDWYHEQGQKSRIRGVVSSLLCRLAAMNMGVFAERMMTVIMIEPEM